MPEEENIVVYVCKTKNEVIRPDEKMISSWGRGTLAVAEEFIRDPKWPAKKDEHFVAVDDWGYGNIVAASRELSNWIGYEFQQFKREFH